MLAFILMILFFIGLGVLAYHPTLYWDLYDKVQAFVEKNKKKE